MLRLLNAVLVLGLLVSAYFIYALEHQTRSGERDVARLKSLIAKERETEKLLTAEWSFLTRPDRIDALSRKYLNLAPMAPAQVIGERDIATRVPAEPIVAPGTPNTDPIGDVLKELE
jgi:hypothetical protein